MLNTSHLLQRRPELVFRNRPVGKSAWKASHRSFQWKYTGFLVAAVFGTVALFLGVAFYQVQQNYEIFKQLAFATNPELVMHLDREIVGFGLFALATLGAVFVFCLVLGLRFTANVIKPVIHLERHMKKVTQGDWSHPDFRFRSNDDLSDLLDTYSYMYRSLRAHTEHEIKLLEKIAIDPNNRESLVIWKTLVQQKRAQLKLPNRPPSTGATVAKISRSPAARRVS